MEAEQKLHSPPTSPTKSLNSPRQTADTSPRQTAEVSPKIPSELMKQLSKELEKKGYFIVNNCLGDSYCKLLRAEIEQLHKEGLLQNEPSIKTNDDGSASIIGESTFFATTLDASRSKVAKQVYAYMQNIAALLSRELNTTLQLDLKNTSEHHKIAVCTGNGGSLPKHLDNDGTNQKDTRKLTVILYLNPSWKPEDEGRIRLYNMLSNDSRDIEPLNDRLLVFYSDLTVHEVLPYHGNELRATITVWLPVGSRKRIHEDKELYWKILMKHFSEYIH